MSDFVQDRLNICNSCEFNVEMQCALCGCDLIIKTAQKEETCPAQPPKWIAQSAQVLRAPVDPRVGCIPCRAKGNKK